MGALIEHINNDLDISEEYQKIFGRPIPDGKFFCPFHPNVNTPAAKRYFNGIKCYSCNRFYTVYDLLKAFNPQKIEEIAGSSVLQSKTNFVTFAEKEKINVIRYDDNDSIENILNQILQANGVSIQ